MSLAILGSTGMLGSALVDYFQSVGVPVIEISRSSESIYASNKHIGFDIDTQSASELIEQLPVGCQLINASGVIKHKINEKSMADLSSAIRVNSLFPHELAIKCLEKNIKVFQIATDCVFSGVRGNYSEADDHDPTDIYGVTKSLGEILSPNVMTLRCSMIGIEKGARIEFLNWVIDQPPNASLNGFVNHLWNGLTTLHVAKILKGIIDHGAFKSGTYHLLPSDFVSKYELAKMAAKEFDRDDLVIQSTNSATPVDRRLITNYEGENREHWEWAGYSEPIGTAEMLSEYANWIKEHRQNSGGELN
jgi:dTDP-4-dehydrorhamnose reductase